MARCGVVRNSEFRILFCIMLHYLMVEHDGEIQAGGYQIEIKQLYGTVALDRSHTAAFMGATKWSNNTAELTAIGQALLTAAATGLQEVAIFYDSTYAQNAAAKIHAPVRRDTPNTALIATVRRIRMNNEAAGMRIQWCHVKGHSEEKGGPRSHGNEAADDLANKGKKLSLIHI